MHEKAGGGAGLRHRFLCHRCGSALTPWLRQLALREALAPQADETWLLPGGFFAHRDDAALGDEVSDAPDNFPWLLAPLGKRWLPTHPDLSRATGCCGLTFASATKPNLVCVRGHDVGLGRRECRGQQWYALNEDVTHQSERDPAPPGDVAPKLARARALVARPLPPLEAFGGDARAADHEAPEGWLDALWLEAPSLDCGGGEAAPSLVLRAKGLPAGQAVVLPMPWAQLVRLLCLDEAPWGSTDVPLVWKGGEGPAVSVSRHDDLVLVSAAGAEPGARLSLVFDAAEWSKAWARLAQA